MVPTLLIRYPVAPETVFHVSLMAVPDNAVPLRPVGVGRVEELATLTITELVGEVPPAPVHVSVKVVVEYKLPVAILPEVAFLLELVPLLVVQKVALVEDQEIFEIPP